MKTLTKSEIGGIVKNSKRKIKPEHTSFLSYVLDLNALNKKDISPYDFAEHIKRSACNLHYGSVNKTGEVISHPLARSSELENIGDFIADIRETVLLIFPDEFATEVARYLPERFYSNPYGKR